MGRSKELSVRKIKIARNTKNFGEFRNAEDAIPEHHKKTIAPP